MVQRVVVIGTSGSGKSSFARQLASALDTPAIELDAAYHRPDWQPPDLDEFRTRVARLISGDRWVVDGNYSAVHDLVWGSADTVVWLDLPRWAVMVQVVTRSTGRATTGRELWNGNRERWRNLLRREPEENIILWAWTTYSRYERRYEAAIVDPRWRHLRFVRVRSRSEADTLLRSVVRRSREGDVRRR